MSEIVPLTFLRVQRRILQAGSLRVTYSDGGTPFALTGFTSLYWTANSTRDGATSFEIFRLLSAGLEMVNGTDDTVRFDHTSANMNPSLVDASLGAGLYYFDIVGFIGTEKSWLSTGELNLITGIDQGTS